MGHPLGRVQFGGPDLPPRQLRNLLQEHVDRAPAGSRIDWATYYFRDRELAQALMRASDRGVRVRLVLEPTPRLENANRPVIEMLQNHGLGGGLYLRSSKGRDGTEGHLHAKVYIFSDPDIAWIGSFNPSGDNPEDLNVISEIGDQDRGHNLLLGIERPELIKALREYVRQLIDPPSRPLWARPYSYVGLRNGKTRLYFYPRMVTRVVEPGIERLSTGDSVRAAISHLKKGALTRALAKAASQGAEVTLLVHDTTRRVSDKAFDSLDDAGVKITRVVDPDDLPMHAKFILVKRGKRTTAWLGSYNFNPKSRFNNAEVLLATTDADVVAALQTRFDQIRAMVRD